VGFNLVPRFVPIKSVQYTCEDDQELGCEIHLSTYGVNSLGAGWTGPHTDYSYYSLLLCWSGESMCASTFFQPRDNDLKPKPYIGIMLTFRRGTVAMRRIYGKDEATRGLEVMPQGGRSYLTTR
jgi:hypothetical protein